MSETKINLEQKESFSREVWFIDDTTEIVNAILRGLKYFYEGKNVTFRHFEKARDALREIQEKIKTNKPMVSVIFMDYLLDKDEGGLNRGTAAIQKIRHIAEIAQPIILAFSSDESYSKKLIEAGANQAVSKMDLKEIKDALDNILKNFDNK